MMICDVRALDFRQCAWNQRHVQHLPVRECRALAFLTAFSRKQCGDLRLITGQYADSECLAGNDRGITVCFVLESKHDHRRIE